MTTHRVRRTPSHRGPAAWSAILGAQKSYPQLEGTQTADVVIVGAGFAGLSAARRLLQLDPTLCVSVLDAGQIGEGGTGRNSGFMIDIPHDLTSEAYAGQSDHILMGLNRHAIQFAGDAVAEYGTNRAFFDPIGKINGAASPAADLRNNTLAKHLTKLDEKFEVYDAKTMAEITGTSHYSSGLYTLGTVLLQPAGYTRGLANGLAQEGVAIHEMSPVVQLEKDQRSWTVQTTAGKVSAKVVILAVNGHLVSFGFAKRQLMHVFLFAAMTPDLPESALTGQPRWGVTPSDPMGTTVRRIDTELGGNRIVTRTMAVLRPEMEATHQDMRRAKHTIQKKFDKRFPHLKGQQMEHVWAGHLCLSRNGVSVVKEVDQGIFSACVQNGLGTTRGTLSGIAAAEMALGYHSNVRAFFEDQEHPVKLPPAPLQSIGVNAVIRAKEWRARSE